MVRTIVYHGMHVGAFLVAAISREGRQEMEINISTIGPNLFIVFALIPRKIDSRNIEQICRSSQFMWQGYEGIHVRVNTKNTRQMLDEQILNTLVLTSS